MSFAARRSLPSVLGLVALLVVAGFGLIEFVGGPGWLAPTLAVAIIGLQYRYNPTIIEWLVPAVVHAPSGGRYNFGDRVASIVTEQCARAGIPLVRIGIVDDGTPNAFTFGHNPADARIWISRGLLERLDDDELEAVIAHEVGHIKNWDFVVMTVAAVVPMLLYLAFRIGRSLDRGEARLFAMFAYVGYVIAQCVLLAVNRSRELAADHWSCEATANGDALASALIKISYGIGEADAEMREQAAALEAQGKPARKKLKQLWKDQRRAQAMQVMGILEPRQAQALASSHQSGVDPARAIAAIRWEVINPWGRVLELFSSHPLTARRIAALDQSGLPGRPQHWTVIDNPAVIDIDPGELAEIRTRFRQQLAIAVAPWIVLIPIGIGAFVVSNIAGSLVMCLAGFLFVGKQAHRYPAIFGPAEEIGNLLDRLDAGPIAGIPVEVHGTIIGRSVPGDRLASDLVLQDESGFVPLIYRQPIPGARAWFAWAQAPHWVNCQATVTGWYRRTPGPVIELRTLDGLSWRRNRSWDWLARKVAAWALVTLGMIIMLAGIIG